MPELKEKESDLQAAIVDWLKWHKWYVVKTHSHISMNSHPGMADIYAIKKSRQIWIEAKTATGKLTEKQQKFGCAILAHGGEYLLARSVDDVINYLAVQDGQVNV